MDKVYPFKVSDIGSIYMSDIATHRYRCSTYECVCGNIFICKDADVKAKVTTKCGVCKERPAMSTHRLFSTWNGMIQRCTNPKNDSYKNYGERGITVCSEWENFDVFLNDMYSTFKEGLSIDRIDVNKGYSPENCRWETNEVQGRNCQVIRRNNTSGYKGVTWHALSRKWLARITVNQKLRNLGSYVTALDAAMAYDRYVLDNNLEHTTNGVL